VQGTHINERPAFSSYWGLKNDIFVTCLTIIPGLPADFFRFVLLFIVDYIYYLFL
jgi:hypothetical protein